MQSRRAVVAQLRRRRAAKRAMRPSPPRLPLLARRAGSRWLITTIIL